MKRLIFHTLKLFWFMLGLFLYGIFLVFLIKANLGVSPWDVLHLGLVHYLPFSFGQIMIGTGFLCVLISYPLGVKPTLGTILNMIFIGIFADLILQLGWVPQPASYLLRIGYMLIGILGCGLATGVYITAQMVTGPRDSLMMGLNKITGWRIGVVRTLIEVTAVTLGYIFGGPVGVGTLVFTLGIGWATELFLNSFYWVGRQAWFVNHVSSLHGGRVQNQEARSA
jgi:uncharacterized membrane protein YczE